jgi:septum formation protein
MSEPRRIVLASGSPRRRALLTAAGLEVEVRPADVDESSRPGEEPVGYVRRLAVAKAEVVAHALGDPEAVVIAADTTVDRDGCILAKPLDDDDARAMLRSLSGRRHLVHTGVAVHHRGATQVGVATTAVTFGPLSDEVVDDYVRSGEPRDKAGAYAIQGGAAGFVRRVDGSHSNVVGLPLELLGELLARVGVRLPADR